MHQHDIDAIAIWAVERGLVGASEKKLLHGFCERCRRAGIELARALALIDTLHPIYEGRAFRWRNDGVEEEAVLEYRPTNVGEAAENWRRSAFFHLLQTGESEVRRRIGMGEPT